jgi:aminobenzoyl-glutamate utilization protein B
LYSNLALVGPPRFTDEEKEFSKELQRTMNVEMEEPLDEGVELHGDEMGFFSQDDGDLSWLCPVARVRTTCWPHRIASHTWQATACTGSSIGYKGMLAAAKTLALTGLDLFAKPEIVQRAKDELKGRSAGFKYRCLIPPNVKPIGEPPLIPLSD